MFKVYLLCLCLSFVRPPAILAQLKVSLAGDGEVWGFGRRGGKQGGAGVSNTEKTDACKSITGVKGWGQVAGWQN